VQNIDKLKHISLSWFELGNVFLLWTVDWIKLMLYHWLLDHFVHSCWAAIILHLLN